MFCGKLFNHIKLLVGFPPFIAGMPNLLQLLIYHSHIITLCLGGVRWYLEWEQIDQLDQIGILRIVNVILPEAEKMKISQ